MNFAPIALFVYNRPDHARRTLEALARNEFAAQTALYVFADAARDAAAAAAVAAVREQLRAIQGFKSVTVIEQPTNLGLAKSIIGGVTRVCGEHDRVIVVEDDLQTSPHFLRFMNEALEYYADDDRVASIHGYWYPIAEPMPTTFFLRGASCWGWATWSRGWQLFENDGGKLLAELERQSLTRAFDLDGAMAYTRMLRDQIAGRNNSWAIRWHASTFLANRLQLSPGRSLVRNFGFDGSGTHCDDSDVYSVQLATSPVTVGGVPVEPSATARTALIRYYHQTRRSLADRVVGRIRRMLGR